MHHLRPALTCLLLVSGLLAGVPAIAAADLADAPTGQAVVALIDTGINPYNVAYRDDSPLGQQHPSTYIEGFPADAPALHLTLDAEDYDAALVADCATWAGVERGQLYWVPGTRIIGAASFQHADATCEDGVLDGEVHILDGGGHGTMTSSRAAGAGYGACPTCRIVAIEYTGSVNLVGPAGSEDGPIEAIDLAARHADWIDVQSNSWGPIVPAYDPTSAGGLLGANPHFIREVERVSAAMPAFWASGNGAAFRGGALGHPTPLTPHATPSAIMVGGHDSGYVTTWPGFPPHLVSDACASWAAEHDSIEGSAEDIGGGTSGATPFVAGRGAQLLADARALLGDTGTGQQADGVMAAGDPTGISGGPLADGVLTRTEWQRLLYTTATPRPAAQHEDGPPCGVLGAPYNEVPVAWQDVPDGFPEYLNIGYGAVDDPAQDLARAFLRGEAEPPDRSATDTYFEAHHTVGGITHEVFTTAP
jgi:hypothetical protein